MTEQDFQQHVIRIKLEGYTVLPGLLTSEECNQARKQLDRLAEESPVSGGGLNNLFNKGRIFERIYQLPDLLRLIRYFLGQDAALSGANGSIKPPGTQAGGLHADGSSTGHNRALAEADDGRRITSHVLGLNVIFCISDFTRNNGATHLVPGSFQIDSFRPPPPPIPGQIIVEAKRGSALVFNYNTWHGASENRSQENRYAILSPWRRQWLRPENELSRIVSPEVLERSNEEEKRIFGVGALPPYLDSWQWDRSSGRPKPEWEHLTRD